ncbi:MAG: hypothetical protein ACLR5Q_11490 [Coprococcus sp.]
MTFADELRSNKGPQLVKEEISSRQYRLNLHVKAVLEELKRFALSQIMPVNILFQAIWPMLAMIKIIGACFQSKIKSFLEMI